MRFLMFFSLIAKRSLDFIGYDYFVFCFFLNNYKCVSFNFCWWKFRSRYQIIWICRETCSCSNKCVSMEITRFKYCWVILINFFFHVVCLTDERLWLRKGGLRFIHYINFKLRWYYVASDELLCELQYLFIYESYVLVYQMFRVMKRKF